MFEQRTEEWFAQRAGKFTASRIKPLMARISTGEAAARRNMIATLAVERLAGRCVETYKNAAMQRGVDLERDALNAYSFETNTQIQSVSYIPHPALNHVGCSPDGLIDDNGLVEVKCPSAMGKHLNALLTSAHAQEYRWQLQHQLFVTEREWVDIVSYDPRYPEGLKLAIERVGVDLQAQKAIADEIARANEEVESIVQTLKKRKTKSEKNQITNIQPARG